MQAVINNLITARKYSAVHCGDESASNSSRNKILRSLAAEYFINIWQEKEVTKILPSEGKSMYPLIKRGDNIGIRFTKPENARVGDIVAFRRDNATIVHRLIKKKGSQFIEKGDFQIKGSLIDSSIIFGKVEIQNCFFGYIISIFGYSIHRLGRIAKPLLVIPYIINAGTRIYTKLRKA